MTNYAMTRVMATAKLGRGARQTIALRMLTDGKGARLQQLWKGPNGSAWFDVPQERVDALPAREDGVKPAQMVMTPEEYARKPIEGWHEVCRDVVPRPLANAQDV